MNFIEGHHATDGGAGVVTANGMKLPLAQAATAGGRAVTYGIRPEHLSIADDGLEVEIKSVEPTGSETHIVATFGGQDISAVLRERIHTRPGDKIWLKPDLRFVHLFDAATGKRI
jgi:multiple sugar transport system ATP-binding protein